MDSFGNYPREKFDPFSVMLFKGLQVVAFLFFIALLVINPEAKTGKIDTKAEFLITASWPDSHACAGWPMQTTASPSSRSSIRPRARAGSPRAP